MVSLDRLRSATSGVIAFSLSLSIVIACTSENERSTESTSNAGTIPLWKTVVDATLIPTVTPSPTSTPNPEWTPTSTPDPSWTPTPTPTPTSTSTVTPTPSPTPEPLSEREAYCRAHALPTSTPEPGQTPTPIPTSPPGIADDQIPSEWVARMDEIEEWVRDFYEVEAVSVGEFNRRFVEDEVWKEWRADAVEDFAEDEDSLIHLWEQINRTLTLLSPDSDYTEFIGDYQGESYIGLYNPMKREIVVRSTTDEFNLDSELVYVHEYAHHVQNAKYDLQAWRECFKDDGDASAAYSALFEGDASGTEYAYIEEVIGWDRLTEYVEGIEARGGDSTAEDKAAAEPVMKRYLDEINDFTYSTGTIFVWVVADYIHQLGDCPNCEIERQRIDEAFKKPPFTTEQIYDSLKYFGGETPYSVSLPDGVMGANWDLRHSSRIGKSDWVALLVALSDVESDEFLDDLPEWHGDYGVLFENEQNQGLYLQVALWQGDGYINLLTGAFDETQRLKERSVEGGSDISSFEDYSVWENEAGVIVLAVDFEPIGHVYTMFLGTGPDLATVNGAVHSARDNLEVERGSRTVP